MTEEQKEESEERKETLMRGGTIMDEKVKRESKKIEIENLQNEIRYIENMRDKTSRYLSSAPSSDPLYNTYEERLAIYNERLTLAKEKLEALIKE